MNSKKEKSIEKGENSGLLHRKTLEIRTVACAHMIPAASRFHHARLTGLNYYIYRYQQSCTAIVVVERSLFLVLVLVLVYDGKLDKKKERIINTGYLSNQG